MAAANPSAGTSHAGARERRGALGLARAFAVLLAFVVGLMTLGALVRAHEAGLACPDWPLCFGQLIPRMDLKVAFEWSHRALAGSITLVFAGLTVAVLRRPGLSRALRSHLALTAVVLGVQIVLGALTVFHLLASWTVTAHLLAGNAFAVALLFTALRLRELARPPRHAPAVPAGLRALVALTAGSVVLQVALGGLVSSRFAGLACPEWPTCNGGAWFPSLGGSVGLHLLHRTHGYVLWLLLSATAASARAVPGLRGPALLAFGIGTTQLAVGVANVVLGLPVEVTGLHSLLAALLVLSVAATARRAFLRDARGPEA